jgi:hypothetical protein
MNESNIEHRDAAGESLRRLMVGWRDRQAEPALASVSAPAFRAIVAERLRLLEREVAEVRGRVNGLLFVVAGAVVTQILVRLLG